MALKPLNTNNATPLGQFDGYDSVVTSFKGGEVASLLFLDITGSDKAAYDVNDGYVGTSTHRRPAVTFNLTSGIRPLFLADDGTSGYGTLFGSVVGGTVGQVSTGGAELGPHTATGSGKITLWGTPGLYAVTLDAVDTTSSTGLTTTNSSLAGGAALYATSTGKLTPTSGSAFETVVVGRFIEFSTNGSLVNTPDYLVAALNSPSGDVSSARQRSFTQAVIWFNGAVQS
jgi:hypothetical protein